MITFEEYIRNFDYPSISAMKISSKELIELLPTSTVQLIDIRFKEEYEMWNTHVFKSIPINELPNRLNELDHDKLIVTACPYSTRSNIAMHYLKIAGFNVKYLSDGLIAFNSLLLGGGAKKLYTLIKDN